MGTGQNLRSIYDQWILTGRVPEYEITYLLTSQTYENEF